MDLSELLAYIPDCLSRIARHGYTIIRNFVDTVKKIDPDNEVGPLWAFVGEGNVLSAHKVPKSALALAPHEVQTPLQARFKGYSGVFL